MGWGRLLFLGNLGQQLDIQDQQQELERMRADMSAARQSGHDVGPQIQQLQDDNDELRLYLAAIVRLLLSKGAISQDELQMMVNNIDSEDGRTDGGFRGSIGSV